MKALILFSLFSIPTFAGLEDVVGPYIGRSPRCGVEVSLEGDDRLRFTILDKKGEQEASEAVPFQVIKESDESGRFEYIKEFYGSRGKTKLVVTGEITWDRLKAVRIKKIYSFFNFDTAKCSGLSPIF